MLHKMKIGTKLIVSFGSIWVIVVGLIIASILSLNGIAKQTDEFYKTAHMASVTAWQARRDIRLLEASIYNAIATEDEADSKAAIEQAMESGAAFNEALVTLKEYLPEKEQDLERAITIAKIARPQRELVLELARQNKKNEALNEMKSNYAPSLENVIGIIGAIGEYAEEEAKGFVAQASRTSNYVMLMMVGVGVLVAIFILVLSRVITNSIATPAKKIADRITLLSNGDLASPMPVIHSKDEIGVLAQSTATLVQGIQFMIGDMVNVLTQMSKGNLAVAQADMEYKGDFLPLQTALKQILHSLNNTLANINIASDGVSGGAEQVSSGAQALSQGATEQASSIEELSASIVEISKQVNESAANAQVANQTASDATVAVTKCNEEMQALANAIQQINEKSLEIRKIIKTIEDIAFQTNILALNAAVEAARAGSAGKGFAVVADEVRNLASKSSAAAKSTTTLIEESVHAVQNGTALAKQTANQLVSVVEGAKATTMLIGELTRASEQQAIEIEQINTGIDQISSVVQNNSAISEESAAASEELAGQANVLKDLVSRFQLQDHVKLESIALPVGEEG